MADTSLLYLGEEVSHAGTGFQTSVQVALGRSFGGKPIVHDFDASPVLRISGSPGHGCLMMAYYAMVQMRDAGHSIVITECMADLIPFGKQSPVIGTDHMLYEVEHGEADGKTHVGIFNTWDMDAGDVLNIQKRLATAPGKFIMVASPNVPLGHDLATKASKVTSDEARRGSDMFAYRDRIFLSHYPESLLDTFRVNA